MAKEIYFSSRLNPQDKEYVLNALGQIASHGVEYHVNQVKLRALLHEYNSTPAIRFIKKRDIEGQIDDGVAKAKGLIEEHLGKNDLNAAHTVANMIDKAYGGKGIYRSSWDKPEEIETRRTDALQRIEKTVAVQDGVRMGHLDWLMLAHATEFTKEVPTGGVQIPESRQKAGSVHAKVESVDIARAGLREHENFTRRFQRACASIVESDRTATQILAAAEANTKTFGDQSVSLANMDIGPAGRTVRPRLDDGNFIGKGVPKTPWTGGRQQDR